MNSWGFGRARSPAPPTLHSKITSYQHIYNDVDNNNDDDDSNSVGSTLNLRFKESAGNNEELLEDYEEASEAQKSKKKKRGKNQPKDKPNKRLVSRQKPPPAEDSADSEDAFLRRQKLLANTDTHLYNCRGFIPVTSAGGAAKPRDAMHSQHLWTRASTVSVCL